MLGLGHRGGRGDGRKSSSLGSKKKKKMGAEGGQRGRHDAGDQEGQECHDPGERHGKCWGVQGVGVAIGIFGGQTRLEVVKCENRDHNISLTYLLVVSVNISRIQGCLTFFALPLPLSFHYQALPFLPRCEWKLCTTAAHRQSAISLIYFSSVLRKATSVGERSCRFNKLFQVGTSTSLFLLLNNQPG